MKLVEAHMGGNFRWKPAGTFHGLLKFLVDVSSAVMEASTTSVEASATSRGKFHCPHGGFRYLHGSLLPRSNCVQIAINTIDIRYPVYVTYTLRIPGVRIKKNEAV